MHIKIKSNIKKFTKRLNKFQRKQIPFATAGMLNDLANDVRTDAIKKSFPTAFADNKRAERFARGILRKKFAKKTNLVAEVFDSKGLEYLIRQQEGGIKQPKTGRIAVPTTETKGKLKSRASYQRLHPRNLVNSGKAFVSKDKKRIKDIKGKLLYNLVRSANVPKHLKFYESATRIVKRLSAKRFKARLDKALSTARI